MSVAGPADSKQFKTRVRAIGRRIFELAGEARPRVWEKSWWLEQMTQAVDRDPKFRTRAFQFVDCLPSLKSNRELIRHLVEYFTPHAKDFPKLFGLALGGGPLRRLRSEALGRAARSGATTMAGRFITGFDVPSVIKTLKMLRSDAMAFTLDVLGESTTSYAAADRYAEVYHGLMNRLAPLAAQWKSVPQIDRDECGSMPRVNLSIKLTGLDPHFDPIDPQRAIAEVASRLRPLLRQARKTGAFINVDLESYKHHDLTLDLFKQILLEDEFADWSDVGIVLQAYLKEAERDLDDLLAWGRRRGTRFAIRLVKGAYWDTEVAAAVRNNSEPPVWTKKWQSDACYERMTRTMLGRTDLIRPAFGSHNIRSLAVVCATAEELSLPSNAYEVQMLYGMGDPLKHALAKMGRCVRVYCPYGDLMPGMGYLIRRLLENTSNEGFLKQSFQDRRSDEELLADPAIAQPPSAPLPTRHYVNTDPEEPMSTFINASSTSFTSDANRKNMLSAIEKVRGEQNREYPMFIDGGSVKAAELFTSHNPSNPTESIGRIAQATVADADRAVAAAVKASTNWRMTEAATRASLLRKVAERLESRRFDLAATMILEVGKPWREADADVTEAIDHCRYYAQQIEHMEARPRLRNIPGEDNMLTYSPKGVCAILSPWAFPLAILTGMTSAALAAGNTVVVKPARQASVVAAKLLDIFRDVGFPSGVANFLPGVGETVGRHLVEHSDVHVIAFTGSRDVGTGVIQCGARVRPQQSFIKKMIVEMGGKNAIIVDDDADLDGAVQAIIESAFGFAGQKCSSCSRVIVLQGVYDALCLRLCEATESVTIGPADAPSTLVGPVIDDAARTRIQDYIKLAHSEGTLLVQAKLPAECDDGYFVAPTIFKDVDPNARVAQEEIFGPLVTVIRAADFDEALRIANDTRYALTGGLFSRSPARIERARREFAVGNLYINRRTTGSQVDAQPFGGFKLSGTGVKAGSPDYLLHFMDARCITENTLRSGLVPQQQHSVAP